MDDLKLGFTAAETARFTVEDIRANRNDPYVWGICENGKHIGLKTVCDLLNEQHAAIQALEKRVAELQSDIRILESRKAELEMIAYDRL